MYPVSTAYRERVANTSRIWDLRIDVALKSGETLELTKENLKLGSFVYKDGAVCSDAIHTGATYSSSVEFTISNDNKQYSQYEFYGAKVYPKVGLDTTGLGDFEYVPLGEFNVLEPVKKMSTIPLVCFDNMALLNVPFNFSDLVFPTTVETIYLRVLEQCGISVTEAFDAEVRALDYSINSFLTDDSTCRDIFAGIGVMLLKNLRFNRTGSLESYWYISTEVYTDSNMRVGNSSFGDTQSSVTGVYVEDAYGNVHSYGASKYPIELPTSPMLQGSEMVMPILQQTLHKLQERLYRPATITWIGDPAIQAGDILQHKQTPVGTVDLLVMRVVYKFAGTSTLDSLGPDAATLEQSTSTERKMRKAFEAARQNFEELQTQINQTAEKVEILASKTVEIQIGARNLIRNSTNMLYDAYYFDDKSNSIDAYTRNSPENKAEECARFSIVDPQKSFTLSQIVTPGQRYTFSFWITANAASTISVAGNTFEVYTDWRKHQLTFEATSANLQIYFNSADTFYMYHPKLEIGNQATDWTLAPEDSENFATWDALGELEQGMQDVRENVSRLSVEADGIRTSVLNAQQLIDAASGEIKQIDAKVTKVEQSATDISISVQSIQENGVSKVNTTTGFAFDEKGMSVDKTDSPTKTTVTPDGMKVYSKTNGDSEVLSATSSGVDATNLHAKTYLIIGGRSRFENYGNDRTGCFWIGD